jgi:3-oxoacyl-[acyl-carrier-protein] synthase II
VQRYDEGIVDKKNARRMDNCLQYALVSGNKAMVDAGLGEDWIVAFSTALPPRV